MTSEPQRGAAKLAEQTSTSARDRGFLITWAVTFTSLVLLIALVAVAIDPFGTFDSGLLPPVTWQDRKEKVELFDLAPPPELLILGSSRMMKIDPACTARLTTLPSFNFALNSARSEDFLMTLRYVLARPHKLKQILVGVDPEAFHNVAPPHTSLSTTKGLADFRVPEVPSRWMRLGEETLSQNTLSAAARSIRRKLSHFSDPNAATFGPDGLLTYVAWEAEQRAGTFRFETHLADSVEEYHARFAGFDRLSPTRLAHFSELLTLAKSAHVSVDAIIVPLHPALEEALRNSTFDARRAEVIALLQRFAAQGQLRYSDTTDLARFGGSPDHYFDGAHMDAHNAARLAEYVFERRGCAVQ